MASPSTRDRLLEVTGRLFVERGYHGTGLKAVAAESSAAFGSLYHFFPGGKSDLAAEALRAAADVYMHRVAEVLGRAPDAAAAVRQAFDAAAGRLEETDFADACPIATVALEVASTDESLRLVTAEIFEGWLTGLEAFFRADGIAPPVAHDLAILFLAALEGGFLLSRAAKDTAAIRHLGRSVTFAVEQALTERDQPAAAAARDRRGGLTPRTGRANDRSLGRRARRTT